MEFFRQAMNYSTNHVKSMRIRILAPVLLILLFSPGVAAAQSDTDGVREAVLDYVEGIYDVQPERIDRSVSRDLTKFGWFMMDGEYRPAPMNFDQLRSLAARWNADNRQGIDETTVKEVVVLDVLDKTAVAKLTAQWGIDYFQLEKIDGKWMIRHVLWQSHPD